MLTENDVVDNVCEFLGKQGYTITQALKTKQQGIDIIAKHPQKGFCYVEAKGATSSKIGSKRYGKEFTRSQAKVHVGVAILTSLQTLQRYPEAQVVMALPDNNNHREMVELAKEPIQKSGIRVYLVGDDGSVEVYV